MHTCSIGSLGMSMHFQRNPQVFPCNFKGSSACQCLFTGIPRDLNAFLYGSLEIPRDSIVVDRIPKDFKAYFLRIPKDFNSHLQGSLGISMLTFRGNLEMLPCQGKDKSAQILARTFLQSLSPATPARATTVFRAGPSPSPIPPPSLLSAPAGL